VSLWLSPHADEAYIRDASANDARSAAQFLADHKYTISAVRLAIVPYPSANDKHSNRHLNIET
jgi:hypothetical protein